MDGVELEGWFYSLNLFSDKAQASKLRKAEPRVLSNKPALLRTLTDMKLSDPPSALTEVIPMSLHIQPCPSLELRINNPDIGPYRISLYVNSPNIAATTSRTSLR